MRCTQRPERLDARLLNRGWGARELASSLSVDFGPPAGDFRKQMGSTFVNTPWRGVDESSRTQLAQGAGHGPEAPLHTVLVILATYVVCAETAPRGVSATKAVWQPITSRYTY